MRDVAILIGKFFLNVGTSQRRKQERKEGKEEGGRADKEKGS